MRSLGTDPTLTYVLIAVNVVAGFASIYGGNVGNSANLADAGELSRFTMASGDFWTLLTSGFLHVNLFHLLSNMLALWILGTMLEPMLGRWRFALVYFVSLLCGSLGVLLLSADESVGASGAVFGLMGAALVVMRSRGVNPMESGLGLWLGLNLLITFAIPHISIGGHIGGLIGGALVGLVLVELGERRPMPRYVPELACAAIGVAAVLFSIAQYS
jgi:membrane associated rhomboid family serine protease